MLKVDFNKKGSVKRLGTTPLKFKELRHFKVLIVLLLVLLAEPDTLSCWIKVKNMSAERASILKYVQYSGPKISP